MTRLTLSMVVFLLASSGVASAAEEYAVKGMVVSVNRPARTFTASIEDIPNFMRAMTMPFEVLKPDDLDNLAPGAIVEFTLVVDKQSSHAVRIRVVRFESVERDPFSASRLA